MNYMKPNWQYSNDAERRDAPEPQYLSADDWPSRLDAGKRAEVVYQDGRTFVGRLEIEDTVLVEDEEMPLFAVVDDAGRRHGLLSAARWRILEH